MRSPRPACAGTFRRRDERWPGMPTTSFVRSASPAGSPVLLTLHRAAPVTVGDLAKRLTMAPSTATADLKPLERRGLVVSRPHATDGRVRLVALTDVGRAVLAAAIELWAAADDRATRRFWESEVRALCLALRRLSTIDPPGRASAAI